MATKDQKFNNHLLNIGERNYKYAQLCCAQCSVLSAQCSVLSAQCSVLRGQCSFQGICTRSLSQEAAMSSTSHESLPQKSNSTKLLTNFYLLSTLIIIHIKGRCVCVRLEWRLAAKCAFSRKIALTFIHELMALPHPQTSRPLRQLWRRQTDSHNHKHTHTQIDTHKIKLKNVKSWSLQKEMNTDKLLASQKGKQNLICQSASIIVCQSASIIVCQSVISLYVSLHPSLYVSLHPSLYVSLHPSLYVSL